MKINFKYLFLLFIIISCRENKFTTIEIISPTENQIYNGLSIVEINANILDDGDSILNEGLLVTKNNSVNSTPIIDFKDTKFCFEYNLKKSFTAEPGNEYKIEITARGGHGNLTTKTVIISCQ